MTRCSYSENSERNSVNYEGQPDLVLSGRSLVAHRYRTYLLGQVVSEARDKGNEVLKQLESADTWLRKELTLVLEAIKLGGCD